MNESVIDNDSRKQSGDIQGHDVEIFLQFTCRDNHSNNQIIKEKKKMVKKNDFYYSFDRFAGQDLGLLGNSSIFGNGFK